MCLSVCNVLFIASSKDRSLSPENSSDLEFWSGKKIPLKKKQKTTLKTLTQIQLGLFLGGNQNQEGPSKSSLWLVK